MTNDQRIKIAMRDVYRNDKFDPAIVLFFAFLILFFPLVALIIKFKDEVDAYGLLFHKATGWLLLALWLYLVVRAGRNYTIHNKLF
jgi:hypothetical protein